MATMICALCDRPVEARRHIGVGTVALAVLTGGIWLIAVPFYPKRCAICQSTAVTREPLGTRHSLAGASSSRIEDLEKRLSLAEGELETAGTELNRLTTERDFYRQLLEDPAAREKHRRDGSRL